MKASEIVVRVVTGLCLCAALYAVASTGPAQAQADGGSNTNGAGAAIAPTQPASTNTDFTTAMAMIRSGDVEQALPRLREAAADEPGVFEHQFALAAVCLRLKHGPEGWIALRKAVRIRPGDAQASGMFAMIWGKFDHAGIFNAGNAPEPVRGALGAPDAERSDGPVTRLEYGFMGVDFVDGKLFCVVDLRGLPIEAMRPTERMAPPVDARPWRLAYRQVTRTDVMEEYVLPGQTAQKHEEMLSTQRLIGLAERGVSVDQFAEHMRAGLARRAPKATWRIIARATDELTYEFIVPAGSTEQAQHEIGRLVAGLCDLHRAAYVKIGSPMTDAERDKWLRQLAAAKVVSVGAPSAAASPDPASASASPAE